MQDLIVLLSNQSKVINSLQRTIEGLNFTISNLNVEIQNLKVNNVSKVSIFGNMKDVNVDEVSRVDFNEGDKNFDINVTTFSTNAHIIPVHVNEKAENVKSSYLQ